MNLDDCYRLIADIPDQELKDLIGMQRENQRIDFKQKYDRQDPNDQAKHKREICTDVTAMANAEGGYILIGVNEKAGLAQEFFNVDNPTQIAQSIGSICLNGIDPPIRDLQVAERSFECDGKDITLVIVHIPPSDFRPHGFKSQGSINFVKRYGTDTREYPMTDLGVDFAARHLPPTVQEINEKLDTINRNTLQIRHIKCLLNRNP